MKVKILFASSRYEVVATVGDDGCAAEQFLIEGDPNTERYREGLLKILEVVAESGLDAVPTSWLHEANKPKKIFEFIKGPLRLFFFKGEGKQIAVCTGGVRKKGQKADRNAVDAAARARDAYFTAIESETLEIDDEQN